MFCESVRKNAKDCFEKKGFAGNRHFQGTANFGYLKAIKCHLGVRNGIFGQSVSRIQSYLLSAWHFWHFYRTLLNCLKPISKDSKVQANKKGASFWSVIDFREQQFWLKMSLKRCHRMLMLFKIVPVSAECNSLFPNVQFITCQNLFTP